MKTLTLKLTLVAALALATVPSLAQDQRSEADLIAVLKSDAPRYEKSQACRTLGRVGTKNAVPELAALLGDE